MKLHELAKKIGFKSPEVLSKAKDLGLQITGIGSNLKPEEEEILTRAFEGVAPTRVEEEVKETDTIPYELKKGAFIGIVFNGENFVIVGSKMTLDQIKRFETELISEHKSFNGALIELNKKLTRVINVNTVKTFK